MARDSVKTTRDTPPERIDLRRAGRLSVSTNTVKWHLRNIFEKLQINNRMQAVAVARQLGLVE